MEKGITNNHNRGFTIVELLIVIVVIGILAAITIVSYSGISARAKAAKAQTNAVAVQKVAEAYNAEPPATKSGYPAAAADITGYNGIAKLPTGVTVNSTLPANNAASETAIYYLIKNSGAGGCVAWYDFGSNAVKYIALGNETLNVSGVCV